MLPFTPVTFGDPSKKIEPYNDPALRNPNQGLSPINSGTPPNFGSDNDDFGGYSWSNPFWYGGEDDEGGDDMSGGGSWGGTLAGAGAGALAVGGLLGAYGSSKAGQRNLPAEIGGILSLGPTAAGSSAATQGQLNPYLTGLNVSNFNGALGGVGGSLRAGYDAANPLLSQYSSGLGGMLEQVNAQPMIPLYAHGYATQQAQAANAGPAAQGMYNPAAATQAGFTNAGPANQASFMAAQAQQAQAAAAAQQRASGGPLLGTLQSDAMRSLGGISSLQSQQQQIAGGLLSGGGNLSAQDQRNVQQDTRAAFAARGLYDSNQAIGAEVMNTDAARRNRLMQNMGLAQGVDAAGQQQIGQSRGYATSVQNQGQQLNQFNSGQGNQLGMFNANQLGDTSRYNAGLFTQNNQFNSQLGSQTSQFNAGARNQMAQYNAGAQNQSSQYNAGLLAQNNQFNAGQAGQMSLANAGAQNQMGQYNAGLQQQTTMANTGAANVAEQYNAGVINSTNLFNAQTGAQYNNDQWSRAMQLGGFYQNQAINPAPVAMGLMGQAPDYTNGLLGYGSDLYNTNLNASSASSISRNNNNAALAASGINALYNLYGKPTT